MEPEEGAVKVSVRLVQIESWSLVIILFTLGSAVWAFKSLAHLESQQICVCCAGLYLQASLQYLQSRLYFKVGCTLWR